MIIVNIYSRNSEIAHVCHAALRRKCQMAENKRSAMKNMTHRGD
jgi:hypothetical protein